mgnify:CR=1 FL=1
MYPIKLQKTGMLTIQKVTVADCELINKMAGEVFPATYKEILSPEQLDYMMDWMYAPENIRKQMEEEGHVYFIAYKEGKPCGYVSVQQQEKIFSTSKRFMSSLIFKVVIVAAFYLKKPLNILKKSTRSLALWN